MPRAGWSSTRASPIRCCSTSRPRRTPAAASSPAPGPRRDRPRCSGLYPCIRTQPGYFAANRAEGSLLYTDHAIYAPRVPWFRGSDLRFLERPYLASVIVSPAPNAGEVLAREPDAAPAIEAALRHRVATVLAIARAEGHRALVLGAWGCGVFRNDPRVVAEAFAGWLQAPAFAGAFERVVFAIHDRSRGRSNLTAFQDRFRTESRAGA
ncbi:MAG: TIGR02452 family protein [Polyangiaceae bacterium]